MDSLGGSLPFEGAGEAVGTDEMVGAGVFFFIMLMEDLDEEDMDDFIMDMEDIPFPLPFE